MGEYKTQDYEQIPYQVAELNKQIILLKAENEKLKEQIKSNSFGMFNIQMAQCLDEIEEIAQRIPLTSYYRKQILQKINQAKEGGE